MTPKRILENMLKAMQMLRRTGSTTTMMDLYSKKDSFTLITQEADYGEKLIRSAKLKQKVFVISVQDALNDRGLRGNHTPIAIDTAAFIDVIECGIEGMNQLSGQLAHTFVRFQVMKDCLDHIGSIMKRFWPMHYDERKWSHHYNEKEEYWRIVRMADRVLREAGYSYRQHSQRLNAIKYGRVKSTLNKKASVKRPFK